MKSKFIGYGVIFLALIMILTSCGSTGGDKSENNADNETDTTQSDTTTDTNNGTDTTQSGSTGSVFTSPANPLYVDLDLDLSRAASATIPTSGGTLNATGADGTLYSLEIPPDSLAQDTLITMTPVQNMTGVTFSGGLGGAVKFEPEGLYFYKEAILSITPAKNIPIENQIMFGFDGNGSDVHLAMPVVDSSTIQIRLEHFSGAGVGNGVSAEKTAIYNRIADSAENRLTSEMADALSRARQEQLLGIDEGNTNEMMVNALSQYENEVLKPRIKAAMSASATCADGKKAIQSLLSWERQRQLLGISDDSVDMSGLMDAVGRKCADEEYKICAEQHNIVRIIPFALSIERQMQLLGIVNDATPETDLTRYVWSLVEKCLRFELQFESDAQFDDGICCGYQSGVTSKVPIRMEKTGNILTLKLKGSAPLVNTNFNWIPFPDCTAKSERGGGQFDTSSLTWETIIQNESFVLKDFKLSYFPGKTSESFTEYCEDDTIGPMQSSYWTSQFIVTHSDECDTVEGCFVSKDWTVNQADLIGQKSWTEVFTDEGTRVEETGSMKLYHRPGQ